MGWAGDFTGRKAQATNMDCAINPQGPANPDVTVALSAHDGAAEVTSEGTDSGQQPFHSSSSGAGSSDLPPPAAKSNPPAWSIKRIKHDLKMVMRDPLPGIFVHVDEHDITVAHCLVIGPFDTPYEGGMQPLARLSTNHAAQTMYIRRLLLLRSSFPRHIPK
jgi:hypothetical protein